MISARRSLACFAILLLHHTLSFKFVSRRAFPNGILSRIKGFAIEAKKLADGSKYSELDNEKTVLTKKDADSQRNVGVEIQSNQIANQDSYEQLLQSWILSNCPIERRAVEAEEVFQQLIKAGVTPSVKVTISLMNLLGNANQPEKAEQIFDRVSFTGYECDITIYNSLIIAWSKSTALNSAIKAEELLERMEFAGVDPDIVSFESLLNTWSRSNRKDSALKCVQVIRKMIKLEMTPSLESYEKTFLLLAGTSLPDAAELGTELLGMLMTSSHSENKEKVPKKVSLSIYENMILIWLNSGQNDASHNIDRLLHTMETLYPTSDLSGSNAALIISLCKNNKKSKLLDISKADERIVYMEQRNMYISGTVYSIVIDSWCKVGNPQRAERVVDRLSAAVLNNLNQRISSSKKKASINKNKNENNDKIISGIEIKKKNKNSNEINSENGKLSCLIHTINSEEKINAQPWNQIIAAYGVLRHPDTAKNNNENDNDVEKNKKMEAASDRGSVNDVKDDAFLLERARNADRVYSKLLHLSIQIDRERRERHIGELTSLLGIRPDQWTYSALVSIWSCCGRLDKAEEKLAVMVRNGIRPTSVTYSALLRGWVDRYTAISNTAKISSSSTLLTIDPVSDVSGFYDVENKLNFDGIPVKIDRNISVSVTNPIDTDSEVDAANRSSTKKMLNTAMQRIKKIFTLLCRLTQNFNGENSKEDSFGAMLGLEDGDGASYCQVCTYVCVFSVFFYGGMEGFVCVCVCVFDCLYICLSVSLSVCLSILICLCIACEKIVLCISK